jgi:acetyl esterase/lipase
MFTKEGARLAAALQPHVPAGVVAHRDLAYAPNDPEARLDVFRPVDSGPLPTVVWIHGGAWIAGSKDEIANYLQVLASHGFTVVGVDYSLAPGAKYPTPIRQVNVALRYLLDQATTLGIDTLQLYLAGDSGGAQIAAQLALLLRDPTYATRLGMAPGIAGDRLRGVVLFCGPYDAEAVRLDGAFGGFLRTVLWAYSGRRDFQADTTFRQISVVHDVGPTFPPALLSVGNTDPLAPQSRALATALTAHGVSVDTLFFPATHPTPLPHEYQFNLDIPEGRLALERTVTFLRSQTH